jgi:hypothetical protein
MSSVSTLERHGPDVPLSAGPRQPKLLPVQAAERNASEALARAFTRSDSDAVLCGPHEGFLGDLVCFFQRAPLHPAHQRERVFEQAAWLQERLSSYRGQVAGAPFVEAKFDLSLKLGSVCALLSNTLGHSGSKYDPARAYEFLIAECNRTWRELERIGFAWEREQAGRLLRDLPDGDLEALAEHADHLDRAGAGDQITVAAMTAEPWLWRTQARDELRRRR